MNMEWKAGVLLNVEDLCVGLGIKDELALTRKLVGNNIGMESQDLEFKSEGLSFSLRQRSQCRL